MLMRLEIFKTYRDLINYILSHYPYEKLISYCKDLNYKFVITDNTGRNIKDIRYPTKFDIKKLLVLTISAYIASSITTSIGLDDDSKKILSIAANYIYGVDYFRISIKEDRVVIRFSYEYFGWRFRKYPSLYKSSRQGNPRTRVIFKFKKYE